MTYNRLHNADADPERLYSQAKDEYWNKVLFWIFAVIIGILFISILSVIFVALPVVAGICSMHTTELCSVSGSVVTVISNKTYAHDTNSTITKCYYTDNVIAGKGVYLSFEELAFGEKCNLYSIMSIVFWSIAIIALSIYCVGEFSFLLYWRNSNKSIETP